MTVARRRGRDDLLLTSLCRTVAGARSDIDAFRSSHAGADDGLAFVGLCANLGRAMRAYADAAAESGVPLSYRYRDEMRLYEAIGRRRDG